MLFSSIIRMLTPKFQIYSNCSVDQDIKEIRFLSEEDSVYSEHILYVCADSSKIVSVYYKNFLFLSKDGASNTSFHRINYITLSHTSDFPKVFNCIQEALTIANTRSTERNHQRLFSSQSLQEFIDSLAVIVSNPVLLVDFVGHVLIHTHQEQFQQSPAWNNLMEQDFIGLSSDCNSNTTITYYTDKGTPITHTSASKRLTLSDGLECILLIPMLFNTSNFDYCCRLADISSEIMKSTYEPQLMQLHYSEYSFEDSLRKILNGNKRIEIGKELLYYQDIYTPNDGFFIFVCETPSHMEKQHALYEKLAELPNTTVLLFNHHLIAVSRHTVPVDYFLSRVNSIALSFHIRIGTGSPFARLIEVTDRYQSALYTLETSCQLNYAPALYHSDFFAYTIPLQHMLQDPRSKEELIQQYCSPMLLFLLQYDEETGTPFFTTLREYIYSDRNNKECAKRLHIHRNTLAYRLNQISEILGTRDLFGPEWFFVLSYNFRLYDYIHSLPSKT